MPLLAFVTLGLVGVASAAEPVTAVLVSGEHVVTTAGAIEGRGGVSVVVNRAHDADLQLSADSVRIADGVMRCDGHVRVTDHTVTFEAEARWQ